MAKLVALYKKPADAAAFEAYYFGTHAPIAKKVPGLRRCEVSAGPVGTPQGASQRWEIWPTSLKRASTF
jgi:uncharacterized protein (TIGR02118 family)